MNQQSSEGHMLIGSDWCAGTGRKFVSLDSCDRSLVWSGRAAAPSQVALAISHASAASERWQNLPLDERVGYIRHFCEIVGQRTEALALAISRETGKPLWESRSEVKALSAKLEPSLHAAEARASKLSFKQGASEATTRFVPLGVVAVIGPFNFPVHMPNVHIMPALLAGNTVVFKPSELTPLSAQYYAEFWHDAGIPSGVVNLLQGGPDVGEALINHRDVAGVFFTGSRGVGEVIGTKLLNRGKMLALEMGGSNPLVVWDADDIDAAVFVAIQSSFVSSGQRCSSARRLIVRDSEFGSAFLEKFISVAQSLRVGYYTDRPEPYLGPMISSQAAQRALTWQEELSRSGAVKLLEARLVEPRSALLSPGIIDTTSASAGHWEEVLGPIVTVTRTRDEEEVFRQANDSDYGLAAGIITADRALFERFARGVSAGVVSWNSPLTGNSAWAAFGGIKASGNFRPTGYLSTDYCVRAVGALETARPLIPGELPPGVTL